MKKIDLAAFDLGFKVLDDQRYKLRCEAYAKLKELFDAAGITELEIPIDHESDVPVLWSDDDHMVKRIETIVDMSGHTEFNYVTEEGIVLSDFMVSPIDAGIVALQILGE